MPSIPNFIKIRSVASEIKYPDRQTDRHDLLREFTLGMQWILVTGF